MLHRIACGSILAVTLLTGCGGGRESDGDKSVTHFSVAMELTRRLGEAARALDGAWTKQTAKTALPKLEAITDRILALKRQAGALGKPDKQQARLLAPVLIGIRAARTSLDARIRIIRNNRPASAVIGDAIDRLLDASSWWDDPNFTGAP